MVIRESRVLLAIQEFLDSVDKVGIVDFRVILEKVDFQDIVELREFRAIRESQESLAIAAKRAAQVIQVYLGFQDTVEFRVILELKAYQVTPELAVFLESLESLDTLELVEYLDILDNLVIPVHRASQEYRDIRVTLAIQGSVESPDTLERKA